jgi:hypothetical protein
MSTLKTVVATAVVVLAASSVAFGGVHFGQQSAGAATAVATPQPTQAGATAQTTYMVKLTAQDLARLAAMMNGQHAAIQTRTHARHAATHQATSGGSAYAAYRAGGQQAAQAYGSGSASSGSGYHCPSYGDHGCRSGNASQGSSHGGGCW